MNYVVVIEKGESPRTYGAYVPDLPGCVAVGSSRAQVTSRIRAAIAMHLEGMREDGLRPPKANATAFVTALPLAKTAFGVESATPKTKRLIAEANMIVSGDSRRTGVAKKSARRAVKKGARRGVRGNTRRR